MRAADIMIERVFRAKPSMKVAEVAQLLTERQISAVPVVDDDDRVVGIVTEHDLMRRLEIGTERPREGDLDSFVERTSRAAAYVKARGTTVAEVMTRDVVTVGRDAPLAEIAHLMEERGIKRVPVVDGGKLVGIVSRLDLVRALCIQEMKESKSPLGDEEIRSALLEEAAREGWRLGPSSKIVVFEGVVHLFGSITSTQEREALITAARAVPGVRAVQDHLEVQGPRIEFV